jgi:hypothetical protein
LLQHRSFAGLTGESFNAPTTTSRRRIRFHPDTGRRGRCHRTGGARRQHQVGQPDSTGRWGLHPLTRGDLRPWRSSGGPDPRQHPSVCPLSTASVTPFGVAKRSDPRRTTQSRVDDSPRWSVMPVIGVSLYEDAAPACPPPWVTVKAGSHRPALEASESCMQWPRAPQLPYGLSVPIDVEASTPATAEESRRRPSGAATAVGVGPQTVDRRPLRRCRSGSARRNWKRGRTSTLLQASPSPSSRA